MTQSDVIAVRLTGGLGNQLFQYAAARAASLRNDCRLALEFENLDSLGDGHPERAYMLDVLNINAIANGSARYNNLKEYTENTYCFDAEFLNIARGTRVSGYFQSELYFASYRDDLRREVKLIAPVSPAFSLLAETIRGADYSVSIHLRRGDFVTTPSTNAFHGICGRDYYVLAMAIIEGLRARKARYFVFSDDRAEAKRMFYDLDRVIFAETPIDRPWEDMFLMSLCSDNILANSSLSWWAAWRNDNPGKNIVAPRRWVSPEAMRTLNTCDLYLEGTIVI
jgi:Glycosyl transferase family 11